MKKIIIISCLLLWSLWMIARDKPLLFGYGVSSDILSIPLREQSLLSNSTNVYFTCLLNEHLNVKLGFDGLMVRDVNAKQYDHLSGLIIGAGYTIIHDRSGNFTSELAFAASNGFNKFTSFRNYHTDFGLRMMMFKSFYLGTGLRFAHDNASTLLTSPKSSYNWYLHMGMQFYLERR